MSIVSGRTDEEIEKDREKVAMQSLLDFSRRDLSKEKIKDPKPHYPPAVVAICVIVTIILFIWGFCRG